MKTVAVVTPTIAKDTLMDAWKSVYRQRTYECKHYIYVDGRQHWHHFNNGKFAQMVTASDTNFTLIGQNVGKVDDKSFYGHRVYAACAQLINEDYIFLLDEDNWYAKDHVETVVSLMEANGLAFGFSLRNINNADGTFACKDECESLGFFPIMNNPTNEYLVDTSSYCFRRDFFQQVAHNWNWGWGGDRRFFQIMKWMKKDIPSIKYGCTGLSTLNYRLDGNPNSVTREFFEQGNQVMLAAYPDRPWEKVQISS